ncbi:MAG TPA: hypothetical protein VJW76_02720, partial [Verrucomicrobiae bacterium]|nr:hypothetical protein [Verrucomicrobiae bacterium]
LDYKINFVKTGTHYLWVRGSDGGGDSIHAGIDAVDPTGTTLDNIDEPACCGNRLPGGETLVWINGIDLTPAGRSIFDVPAAGVHTLHLWMREDGQIADKVLVTTDVNFVPTGLGPPASPRGTAVQPQFNPVAFAGGSVTLSWTGTGTLEQTDSLSPVNWGTAPSQANPQTVPATGTRFYRIRQ